MAGYLLKLMGPVSLTHMNDNGGISEINLSRTSQGLLAYVALHSSKASISREAVAEALWPETPPEKSRSNLSTALWRLRNSVRNPDREEPLIDKGNRIAIAPKSVLCVDVHQLAEHTQALTLAEIDTWDTADVATLESAVSARRGNFLDGVEGEWTYTARQTCADIYEAGLEALIRFHRHRGNLKRSIDAARQIVNDDPYREDIHAMLVELYALRGQRSRAIAQYVNCRDLLRSELGVRPGEALRARLHDAVGHKGLSNPEFHEIVRTMNQTIGLLARHLDDLRNLMDDR
ncbi:AfsR/SARP family transcriptional regulator [Microvirga pakistanensis]|uniref:AfsR/SARP family transcriptional regulator n=1 Tax=Microvirga pakistanensis TaxID=1682650 RepID=UPI00106D7E85|nr:BTAD domain-containing putative transcriptional regulator [Microvirga pakistanensis]